jgi:Uncharacterized distant relative of homeotic protein bithoraxoid
LAESREERLRSALNELVSRSAEVDAAAVVSMDGLVMASVLPNTLEEDRLGAMSAALLSLGERTSEELGRGELATGFRGRKFGICLPHGCRGRRGLDRPGP